MHAQSKCTATGFAISGANGEMLLLTNAHAVANQVQVQVRRLECLLGDCVEGCMPVPCLRQWSVSCCGGQAKQDLLQVPAAGRSGRVACPWG